jgi:L-seryl-tRNA(Ser) seleniumtransferase
MAGLLMNELLKNIPKVDKVINSDFFELNRKRYKNEILVRLVQRELEGLREEIKSGRVESVREDFIAEMAKKIDNKLKPFTKRAVNGTGIVLNTGLGRAPLSDSAIESLQEILSGYCTLEVDVASGKRGRREDKISELISLITGAESATVVNNNAAAVMICINTLSQKKEAVISRGELVEIGGSFRMPDIIKKSGAKMIEVGATNKTNLNDFESAINKKTGVLLKVHTSNYRINGFVEEFGLKEMSELGRKHGIPVYYDLGGGIFDDLEKYGLPHEPTVFEAMTDGADIFSFSGDKVLGGPQCGIIAGKKELVEKVKKNPLMRVLRTDKIRLRLLEDTLKYFLTSDPVGSGHITLGLLCEKRPALRERATILLKKLSKVIPESWSAQVEDIDDQAGSGALPTEKLHGAGISVMQKRFSANRLSEEMRTISDIPVFGFIKDDKFYISIRTVFEKDFAVICENLSKIKSKYNL